jgi:methionyl-tRNA formyltransferase
VLRLRSLGCDLGLHSANVIYREATISSFRLGILNAHIGILPAYRGRAVAEWTVLQGGRTGVIVFFIDTGIDTGARIVLREFISPPGTRHMTELKKALFACDARLYRRALEALAAPNLHFEQNEISMGRRYNVMSKLFTRAVNEMLCECYPFETSPARPSGDPKPITFHAGCKSLEQ